ncbi:hypothetical protein [Alkalimonas sp.]|uniref:hypothetical protein n=1 Tax=Alkalimonas sp. TaxID=1872453 RepID=UPI00263B23C4|nr:hypothetical protein [Alkalimonas sp.]MCC5826003.1 hypothetical protein [Alkalimonas sp.]
MNQLNEQQAKAAADALLGPQQATIDAKRQHQQAAQQKASAHRKRMAWALPCLAGGLALGMMHTAPLLSAILAVLAIATLVTFIVRQ